MGKNKRNKLSSNSSPSTQRYSLHEWKVVYNRGDGVIDVIVKDQSGAKIDKFSANHKDRKTQAAIGRFLKEKYGIEFLPMTLREEDKRSLFEF